MIHHPALGNRRPTDLMDAMLALLTEDEVPGSLFLGLFLKRLPLEMRDHLVAKDFKNPSKMGLHANRLWDARRAQAVDSLLATASTSPSRAQGRERSDCFLFAKTRLQDQLEQEIVTSTNVLVSLLITAVLHAVSRETPEPSGEGGIKQSSRRRFSYLPPGYPLQPQLFGQHRCITFCFSTPFISCSHKSSFVNG